MRDNGNTASRRPSWAVEHNAVAMDALAIRPFGRRAPLLPRTWDSDRAGDRRSHGTVVPRLQMVFPPALYCTSPRARSRTLIPNRLLNSRRIRRIMLDYQPLRSWLNSLFRILCSGPTFPFDPDAYTRVLAGIGVEHDTMEKRMRSKVP